MIEKRRIQLVSITGSRHPVLPYTCGLLEMIARHEFGPDADEHFEFFPYLFHTADGGVDQLAESIVQPVDIVAMSMYAWNYNRNRKLAARIREKYPNALIIAGGPYIPKMVDRANEMFGPDKLPYDVYVVGEGESAWISILKAMQDTPNVSPRAVDLSHIPNIYLVDDQGQMNRTTSKPDFTQAVPTCSAYVGNANMAIAIAEMDKIGYPRIAIWETNRGCPYSCSFCNWGDYLAQKIRKYDMTLIDEEIEWMKEHVDSLNIADANFGILPRDTDITIDLCAPLKNGKPKRLNKVVVSLPKNNKKSIVTISKLLWDADLLDNGALFALQSLDKETLAKARRTNISEQDLYRLSGEVRDLGIPMFYDLILGLPGETETSFFTNLERLLEQRPTDIRIFGLALFPNSEFWDNRDEYSFNVEPWDIYFDEQYPDEREQIDTVVGTPSMPRPQYKNVKETGTIIEYLHFGKITYYVSWFLKRQYGINLVDFYREFSSYFSVNTQLEPANILKSRYLHRYNQGCAVAYLGNDQPFDIPPTQVGFRKQTYLWLCVMHNIDRFMDGIEQFIQDRFEVDPVMLADIIKYQKAMLIHFDYDPARPKEVTFDYDWHSYFAGSDLVSGPTTLRFKDTEVDGVPIVANDHRSYVHIAGKNDTHINRDAFYIHQDIEVITK